MIQGVEAVRKDLLVLVRRGGGRDDRLVSEAKRRVAKNKSSRSSKQLGGFVMRGLQLRSSMNLGWRRWVRMDI